jgi:hypothetical protein
MRRDCVREREREKEKEKEKEKKEAHHFSSFSFSYCCCSVCSHDGVEGQLSVKCGRGLIPKRITTKIDLKINNPNQERYKDSIMTSLQLREEWEHRKYSTLEERRLLV